MHESRALKVREILVHWLRGQEEELRSLVFSPPLRAQTWKVYWQGGKVQSWEGLEGGRSRRRRRRRESV